MKRFYWFVIIACIAGYSWLLVTHQLGAHSEVRVCIFRQATGIPCPSCGSTRAMLSLFDGNLAEAAHINPLGILLFLMMLITPGWLTADLLSGKRTMFRAFRTVEEKLKRKWIAVPAAMLVLVNWIWNIYKGL